MWGQIAVMASFSDPQTYAYGSCFCYGIIISSIYIYMCVCVCVCVTCFCHGVTSRLYKYQLTHSASGFGNDSYWSTSTLMHDSSLLWSYTYLYWYTLMQFIHSAMLWLLQWIILIYMCWYFWFYQESAIACINIWKPKFTNQICIGFISACINLYWPRLVPFGFILDIHLAFHLLKLD